MAVLVLVFTAPRTGDLDEAIELFLGVAPATMLLMLLLLLGVGGFVVVVETATLTICLANVTHSWRALFQRESEFELLLLLLFSSEDNEVGVLKGIFVVTEITYELEPE